MAVRNSQRFAEIERLMSDYFSCHLAPAMRKVQENLSVRQTEEMRAYPHSAAGILRSLATAGKPGDDPYATLKITGEWNSKTTEDYLSMCKDSILGNKGFLSDLCLIAEEWRDAVIKEIGRERYDALSGKLGCDLAYAYVDHRMEQMMIDKTVKDRLPKSCSDYIIRKAAQSSLFGLSYELGKSPLDAEIETRGEAAYKPTAAEKAAGWLGGAAVDAVSLGGISSWAAFGRFVGIDLTLNAGMTHLCGKDTGKEVSVEECISKGVFGTENNVFSSFRKESQAIRNHENDYIKDINNNLRNKIPTKNFRFMDWEKLQNDTSLPCTTGSFLDGTNDDAAQRKDKYKDVPLIVAPGYEDEYLETMEREQVTVKESNAKPQDAAPQAKETSPAQESSESAVHGNENSWDTLLQNFGLSGFSDIGKNLGYILAMLPDVIVGLFTGKTKSLGMENSLLPLASIVAGMFVRNPILKMLLMGIGGANLLNKAGHEVLDKKQQERLTTTVSAPQDTGVRYRQYADEPLSPRISHPVLQGRCLVADIDNVPSTIQLPDTVIDAYRTGALPLNTLANAILARNDQIRQAASINYEENSRETVSRPRGIQ